MCQSGKFVRRSVRVGRAGSRPILPPPLARLTLSFFWGGGGRSPEEAVP